MTLLLLGQAASIVTSPQLVTNSSGTKEVFYLMLMQAIVCVVSSAAHLILFQNSPDGFHKLVEVNESIKSEVVSMFKNKNFVYLFISGVVGGGVGNYFTVVLEIVTHEYGFSAKESSYFGLISIGCGVISCLVCSIITSKTHKFKLVCLVTSGGTVIATMFVTLAFKTGNFTISALCSAFYGICVMPVYSVPLEFAVEMTYPSRENVSSSLVSCIGTLFAVVPITMAYLFENDAFICLEIGIGLQVISFIFLLITKEELKRRDFEICKADADPFVIN